MFIANISHELRTPLNGIMGMLDLMNQEDSIPFELESKFEAIFESAEGLHQIVNDILDYTKLKTGNFELSSDTFNLAEVSAGIIGKFQNINRKENVQLLFELEKSLPQFIRFDLLRLKQILNNLVDNAIKFTNEGKVTLGVANKGQHGDSCLIEFKVTDTGIGISQDKLPNVFKQFKQLDDSLKKKFGGTGLGLSIVKPLVDLSGGEVEVNSIEGIGSQFKVIIPVKIGEENNELEKDSTKSSFDCRVLLAEDVPTNQIVAKLMLEKIGCSVQVASNGKQGLAMLDAAEFDIVLMDI